jgi:hypothetical protein
MERFVIRKLALVALITRTRDDQCRTDWALNPDAFGATREQP